MNTFATGLQIVVLGHTASRTQELVRAIWGKAMPNRLLVQVDRARNCRANHPVFGKPMENGQPTVYLCQRNSLLRAHHQRGRPGQTLTLPQQRAAGAV